MTKTEKKFLGIQRRYISAFVKANNRPVIQLFFKNGWVHLQTDRLLGVSKYRLSQLEKMCETLESRIKN